MRLLVVPEKAYPSKPLRLVEAFGKHIPAYAILSHTWDRDEVLYADVQNGTSHDRVAYEKVPGAMSQARKDGHRYLWIDTCCIDKSSSAELQEAINSMYAWYARAEVCYVYMADVHGTPAPHLDRDSGRLVASEFWDLAFENHFTRSRWFKRGWTLQELIAPKKVSFFSSDWTWLGTIGAGRPPNAVALLIAEKTGIRASLLIGRQPLESFNIATRMSWASGRETTREEDMAYCLLGIFNVNMPLLYGEGSRAFLRLQEEIMQRSSDHYLFAWMSGEQHDTITTSSRVDGKVPLHRVSRSDSDAPFLSGLLATSPHGFVDHGHGADTDSEYGRKASAYRMTNEGLEIRLPLQRVNDQVFIARLNSSFGIYLYRLGFEGNIYARLMCSKLVYISTFDQVQDREHAELIYSAQRTYTRFETRYHYPARRQADDSQIGELWVSASQATAKEFKPLKLVTQSKLTQEEQTISGGWNDIPQMELEDTGAIIHSLLLEDSAKDRLTIIITCLPGFTFPMLSAYEGCEVHHRSPTLTCELEPAGSKIIADNYTVDAAHGNYKNESDCMVHELILTVERLNEYTRYLNRSFTNVRSHVAARRSPLPVVADDHYEHPFMAKERFHTRLKTYCFQTKSTKHNVAKPEVEEEQLRPPWVLPAPDAAEPRDQS